MMEWSTLRALGNSPIAKGTIAIPLLGPAIPLIARLIEQSTGDTFIAQMDLEYPWQLTLTYAGLMAIALASIVFGLRCPSAIKRFGEASEYALAELPFFVNHHHARPKLKRANQLVQSLGARELQRLLTAIGATEVDLKPIDAKYLSEVEGQLIFALGVEWHAQNFSTPTWRWVCASGYAVGIAAVGISSAVTFARVFSSLVTALPST